jgi:S-adenosylmethionine hydrolase
MVIVAGAYQCGSRNHSRLVAILGSSGFLEISTNKGAASRAAGADKGSEVTVTIA